MLKYIETRSADDDFSNEINKEVLHLKDDEEFRSIYLAMNIHDADKINEGREIGRKEGRAEGIELGTLKVAARIVEKGHSLEEAAELSGIKIEVLKEYLKDKKKDK